MEVTPAQVGPCGYLLAYCRLVFAVDIGGSARTGLLGLEPFYLRVDLCAGWYDSQFYQTEGALQLGDVLLHRYGAECACGL